MITCAICNREFDHIRKLSHHIRSHKMSIKEYYNTYISTNTEGICPVCNKETSFIGLTYGYLTYCSSKCANNYNMHKIKETKKLRYGNENYNNSKKARETCLSKYGVINAFNIPENKNKAIVAAHTEEANQKRKQTNLLKYGAENVYASESIKQKIKEVCVEKYGVPYATQNPDIISKIQNTNLEKYGVVCNLNIPEVISKAQSKDAMIKRINSRKHKDYFRLSSYEQLFKDGLDELGLIEDIDYITQYYSEQYPFACDFYIVSNDMYIEINGFWKHGGHPYTGSESDIKVINDWLEKSKTKPDYNHAIYIWTQSDVHKRNIAIKNNLNFVELWNLDDIKNFISDFTNIQ